MNRPLISICMITYNHERYIGEAIEGVLMQEVDFSVEFLISDDCSADLTKEIIQAFISDHPRGSWIKYHRHSQNRGMMDNFIWTIEQCKGEFIALCEGDDYWIDSLKLKKQVEFLQNNPDCSLVSHFAKKVIFGKDTLQLLGNLSRDTYQLSDQDYHFLQIPTASMMFRNIILFPDWVYKVYGGDRALVFLASQYGKIKILDFIGSVYRIHEQGIEQQYKKDKFSLPLRNLSELSVYYDLALPNFKRYIAKKAAWNNFYLSLQYVLIFRIDKSIETLGKSLYWKFRSC